MTWYASHPPTGRLVAQVVAVVVSRGLLLACSVAVAKVAGIRDYGTFAMALVVFQAGLLLRDAGLGQALIVLGADHHRIERTAFVAVSVVGATLAAVIAVLAPTITGALGLPGAADQLRILALAFGIGSLGIVPNASLERRLRFHARAAIDIASYLSLAIICLVGLGLGFGAASLSWGYVGQGAVQAALALAIAPPTPGGGDRAGLTRLARYAGVLWAGALMAYLATNLDNAVVGRLGGAVALGIYALCYSVGNTVTISLAQALNRVALPYYARDATNFELVRGAITTILPLALATGVMVAAPLIVLAPELSDALFGGPVGVVPLVVLSVFGVARALGLSMGTALNGLGQARATTIAGLILVLIMIAFVVPGHTAAGISGVALVVLAAMLLSNVYLGRALRDQLSIGFGFVAVPSVAMIVLAGAAAAFTPPLPVAMRILAGVACSVAAATWGLTLMRSRPDLDAGDQSAGLGHA